MALALFRASRKAASTGRRGLAASVNYMKSGSPPGAAVEGATAADTPAWVADLATPPPTAFELRRRAAAAEGGEEGSFPVADATKLFKLEARAAIKDSNTLKAKK